MPPKGYKTLTVPDELYKLIKKAANANLRTTAKEVEYLYLQAEKYESLKV